MAGSVLNILFGNKRTQIGNIVLDASVEESHSAKATVTRNPIEDGSEVSDHVRLNSLELKINGVISDTPSVFGLIQNPSLTTRDFVSTIVGKSKRSVDAYNKLIELRNKRETFTVITNLKVYQNMVIEELVIDRNATTANAIHFTAQLVQIQKVSSESTAISIDRLGTSVKKIAQPTKNLGYKTTDTIPENEPLSKNPSSRSSGSNRSILSNLLSTSGV